MTYKDKSTRAEELARIGLELAKESSYLKVTRDSVAEVAQVSRGTINFAIGGSDALRTAIVEQAVKDECVEVVAQALAHKHPAAQGAPDLLKARAAQLIAGM